MQSHFYDHRGLVKIYGMSKRDETRELEIKEKIKELSELKAQSTDSMERWTLSSRILGLHSELIRISPQLGDSYIGLYKPLPRLSGQAFHGDSGGAWVHEDEIVALSTARHCDDDILTFTKELDLSQISSYFSGCEKDINKWKGLDVMLPFLQNGNSMSFATSIWSCRNWIESTLVKINAELDKSLPSSSIPSSSSSAHLPQNLIYSSSSSMF
jgi:hypothetical protein